MAFRDRPIGYCLDQLQMPSHFLPGPVVRTCLAAILPLAIATAAAAQQKPGYEEALARYKTCMERVPFQYHTDGRDRLAQTRSPDALRILVDDYGKTMVYPEYTRYTLASLFGRHFTKGSRSTY